MSEHDLLVVNAIATSTRTVVGMDQSVGMRGLQH